MEGAEDGVGSGREDVGAAQVGVVHVKVGRVRRAAHFGDVGRRAVADVVPIDPAEPRVVLSIKFKQQSINNRILSFHLMQLTLKSWRPFWPSRNSALQMRRRIKSLPSSDTSNPPPSAGKSKQLCKVKTN